MSNTSPPRNNSGNRPRPNNNNRNRNENPKNNHPPTNNRDDNNRNSGRSGSYRTSNRRPRVKPAPVVSLTWWQKILKFFGFAPKNAVSANKRYIKQLEPSSQIKSNTRDVSRKAPDTKKPVDRSRNKPVSSAPAVADSKLLYVGNLAYVVSEHDLQELFKGIGKTSRVEIIYNRDTHVSKGFGFVEMLHLNDASRAIDILHDQHFMGRRMVVCSAKQKDTEMPKFASPQKITLASANNDAKNIAEKVTDDIEKQDIIETTINLQQDVSSIDKQDLDKDKTSV